MQTHGHVVRLLTRSNCKKSANTLPRYVLFLSIKFVVDIHVIRFIATSCQRNQKRCPTTQWGMFGNRLQHWVDVWRRMEFWRIHDTTVKGGHYHITWIFTSCRAYCLQVLVDIYSRLSGVATFSCYKICMSIRKLVSRNLGCICACLCTLCTFFVMSMAF